MVGLLVGVAGSARLSALENEPRVHGLIIGVGDYADAIPDAVLGARSVAEVVRQTYGIEPVVLLDAEATADRVRAELEAVRGLPPGSLVVMYFGGHGVRRDYRSQAYPSDTYLRLHGSTATDYLACSIRLDELWQSLLPTAFTNGMIFLDCCFAGQKVRQVEDARERLRSVHHRGFMLAACSDREVATGNVFTPALIETWQETRSSASCLGVTEFVNLVAGKVEEKDTGFMACGTIFEIEMARCLTRMLEPSALVVLRFPKGCRVAPLFVWDGVDEPRRFRYGNPYLLAARQVSRVRPTRLEILGPGRKVLIDLLIDPSKHRSPAILIDVESPGIAEVGAAGREARWQMYLQEAQAIEGYGGSAAESYSLAAQARVEEDPFAGDRVAWMLERSALQDPDNLFYRVAVGGAGALDESAWAAFVESPELGLSVADFVESVGNYGAAASLAESLAGRSAYASDRAGLLLRARVDYEIAGRSPDAERIVEASHDALVAVGSDLLAGRDREELARTWRVIPKSREGWSAALQDAASTSQLWACIDSGQVEETTVETLAEQVGLERAPAGRHVPSGYWAARLEGKEDSWCVNRLGTMEAETDAYGVAIPVESGGTLCFEDEALANKHFFARPGWEFTEDDAGIVVWGREGSGDLLSYGDLEAWHVRTPTGGATVRAKDDETAMEFLLNKRGFVTVYDELHEIVLYRDGKQVLEEPPTFASAKARARVEVELQSIHGPVRILAEDAETIGAYLESIGLDPFEPEAKARALSEVRK